MTNSESNTITEKQQAFLDALFTDECKGDIRKAMDAAGYAKSTKLGQVMTGKVAVIAAEMARDYLGANSIKAAMATVSVIDDPVAMGNREKLAAAQAVLDRAGVVKQEMVKHEIDAPVLTLYMPEKKPLEE